LGDSPVECCQLSAGRLGQRDVTDRLLDTAAALAQAREDQIASATSPEAVATALEAAAEAFTTHVKQCASFKPRAPF
jgi:hypothetical protein